MDEDSGVDLAPIDLESKVQVILLIVDAYRYGLISRAQLITCLADILNHD